jgi:DNA primase small subunit
VPFCVHPATGRICIPVNPRDVDSFDPDGVPTIGQLLRELDALAEDADITASDSQAGKLNA